MRLLLDTHALLVLLRAESGSFGRAVAGLVKSGEHSFFVSVASLWEIAIKWRLGKLPLRTPPGRLPELLENMDFAVLAITPEHALGAVEPEPATRDPFDRLLLAVCQHEDLRLVTVDRALVGHPLALKV